MANVIITCPTLGAKKPCGIAKYTEFLLQGNIATATVGDCFDWSAIIYKFKPNIFHIQYEYQWSPPNRFKALKKAADKVKAKIVVTMHSMSPNVHEHNKAVMEVADRVIVHNPLGLDVLGQYGKDKLVYMPMGVPSYKPKESTRKNQIATFGFAYFHKGVSDLIQAFSYS